MPQDEDDGHVMFMYQMILYMYAPDENDPDYVAIYIPCIYEVEDDNEVEALRVINECNINVKTSKLILANNENVWAAYEVHVLGGVELDDMNRSIVICLYDTKERFEKEMKGL